MAERVIYKNADDGRFYVTKSDKTKKGSYARIEFDANNMSTLVNALNNWDLSENFDEFDE